MFSQRQTGYVVWLEYRMSSAKVPLLQIAEVNSLKYRGTSTNLFDTQISRPTTDRTFGINVTAEVGVETQNVPALFVCRGWGKADVRETVRSHVAALLCRPTLSRDYMVTSTVPCTSRL